MVALEFCGEALMRVELCNADDQYGKSWNDWSEEKELLRKRSHDEWLKRVLGDGDYVFPWGRVVSVYDQKGGTSRIIVEYLRR